MLIRYVGAKPLPLTLNTPLPYLAKSEHIGTLAFTPECDVPNDDWATFLLTECGEAFEAVQTEPIEEVPVQPVVHKETLEEKAQRWIGKQFSGKAGKWNAFAFLKKHKIGHLLGLKKKQIGDKVIFWALIPIDQADVTIAHAPAMPGRPSSIPSPTEEREPAPIPS